MQIQTEVIHFETEGQTDIINLTPKIQQLLSASQLTEGMIMVFAVGSTAGISTLEFEPGLVGHDVSDTLERIAPYQKAYRHNQTWGDDNGAAHLRSLIIGTSYSVPFMHQRLMLGTWQQIVYLDFDTRPRKRKVVIQITGK